MQLIKKYYKVIPLFILLLLLLNAFTSCKKLVEVDVPVTQVTELSAYSKDASAIAAVTGIYGALSSTQYISNGFTSVSKYLGLSADELVLWGGVNNVGLVAYYTNTLTASPETGSDLWFATYPLIFRANAAIEGLRKFKGLSPAIQQQLLGEALFLRALFNFYLVNVYGDIPMPLATNYEVNQLIPRTPKENTYLQIVEDLKNAQELLSSNYLNATLLSSSTERVRPTKSVATALLARVYLFIGDWKNAELQATSIINNTSLYSLTAINNTFLKNSKEAIWQLQPVIAGSNTEDAKLFIIPSSGPSTSNPVYLSQLQMNSFEPGDQRRVIGNWINSVIVGSDTYYYPYKYKINTQNSNINASTGTSNISEYLMVFRLAEQYLIRSEARAKQNDLNGAIADINVIRARARAVPTVAVPDPLPNLSSTLTQSEVLSAILHERQVELFTEWGNRWLDIKRTNSIDSVMTKSAATKGYPWRNYQKLYPIPISEIEKNSNLTQNTDY